MKLTQTAAAAITPPADKFEVRVFDDDLPGFGLRVLSGGRRSWIIQYRVHGRSHTSTLGRFGKMTAVAARAVAKRKLAQAELGIDPAQEKKTARSNAADTFETVGARFLKFKEGDVKPRSYEQIEAHITKHWAGFNPRSVHQIDRSDIALTLTEIAEQRGLYAANRARATLSNFFAWAMGEGIVTANPVVGTNRKTDEQPRDRVLSDAELAAIWTASGDDDYGSIVRLLILTGQRRDEAGGMLRSEVDLPGRKWTIAGNRTKNGNPHEIPLSQSAIAILKTAMAREGREDRAAVFGDGAAGNGFSGWSKAKAALDKRIAEKAAEAAEAKPRRGAKANGKADAQQAWRIHDIRRTVATRMADLGVLPHVIEAMLITSAATRQALQASITARCIRPRSGRRLTYGPPISKHSPPASRAATLSH